MIDAANAKKGTYSIQLIEHLNGSYWACSGRQPSQSVGRIRTDHFQSVILIYHHRLASPQFRAIGHTHANLRARSWGTYGSPSAQSAAPRA